ncbi:MAG: DUF2235 domain-containing protein [Spirulina sp. SIO3F2]|nr:DUF2235 domain-containing protein [Spirulina sp. SIO3F2]
MKRLIVCCDGTWQKLASAYPTNVVKIAQAIKPIDDQGIPQIVFYDEGIGTEDKFYKIFGGAFGWGIDRNIRDGYQFLSLNYQPGDEIYLFGFSRGAYTVRSLAGFIYVSGLVSRVHIRKTPEAYRLYRELGGRPDTPELVQFREKYSDRVPIKLLGCWDTVGSLGVPDLIPVLPLDRKINEKYRFHSTALYPNVLNAAHAVAIDENRKVFNVTLMQSGSSEQVLHQDWFPGPHGAVGGGSAASSGLSDAALVWMMNHAQSLGLALDPKVIPTGIKCEPTTPFEQPANPLFQFSKPFIRDIPAPASFDESVKQRWQKVSDYRPTNVLPYQAEIET